MRISDWSSDVCASDLVGVAVAAGAGVDAVGHVPGAERRRVAFRQRIALLLALLERLLRLLGRGFAADGEAAVRLAPATATAVFAHVVEAAQDRKSTRLNSSH